ncbi:MAG TPA: hypothetical protein VN132_12040, partial [Bdellovibrio sp.]|nr:hypothetical protein [Bdellovibrio sp.]
MANILNVRVEGSEDFKIVDDQCTGHTISATGPLFCTLKVSFTPSKTGLAKASIIYHTFSYWIDNLGEHGSGYEDIVSPILLGTGIAVELPTLDSSNSCSISAHSKVNIDMLSLQEQI